MSMKTYAGYKLVHANDEDGKDRGVIWWDGQRIRSNQDDLLRRIKRTVIPFTTSSKEPQPKYSDGIKFFKMLPLAFRTGYVHLEPVTVDGEGNEV